MSTLSRARLVAKGWDDDLVFEPDAGPLPEPARDQVLVAVEACGVCYRDLIDRRGGFPFLRLPITPGHEAVGRVVAIGPKASEWQVGDRIASMHRDFCGSCAACSTGQTSLCDRAAAVLGLMMDGGYASHLLAPERCFYRVPDGLAAAHAAILHCTFGTAYRGLVQWGRVQAGQRVLVTGANGGVGAAALQIAKRLGAETVAVIRDGAHTAFVQQQGADRVLVDATGRFHKQLGAGLADVAIDCVGQPTFNGSLRSLKVGGRLVAIGNVVPTRAELNIGLIITKGLQITGSSGATRTDMAGLLALHEASPLDFSLDRELPLAQADAAQRLVNAGGLNGRIVLLPGS